MSDNLLTKIVTDSLDSGNPILFFLTEDDERVYTLINDYFSRKEKEVLVYDPATGFSCPEREPMGLKACARLRRRVEVSLLPNERMKGLAVVSRKASPKVRTYNDTQKKPNSWRLAAGMNMNAPIA